MYSMDYDDSLNMAGCFNDTHTFMRETCPKGLYVHFAVHSLSLAGSAACCIQVIRNCLDVIEKMYCFLNTPKRNIFKTLNCINESTLGIKSNSFKHNQPQDE